MKKLRALALSDLHLGEPNSLLYDEQHGIYDKVIEKIQKLAESDGGLDSGIEELILLGDIVDLSEAPDEKAFANTRNFLSRLLDKVNVDKIIFIPGNHDHFLWVQIAIDALNKQPNNGKLEVGHYYENICNLHLPIKIEDPEIFKKECMGGRNKKVEVWYPFYTIDEVAQNPPDDRTAQYYLFDHGHMFAVWNKRYSGHPLTRLLLGFETDVRAARDIGELERCIYRFVKLVWHTKDSKAYITREKNFDWLKKTLLTARFYKSGTTTFDEDCGSAVDEELGGQIIWYLTNICNDYTIKSKYFHERDFHFVFGHTHLGGRIPKEDKKIRVNGSFISIWNTGGWIVDSQSFSPDACIFYISRENERWEPGMYKMVKFGKKYEGDYNEELLSIRANALCGSLFERKSRR